MTAGAAARVVVAGIGSEHRRDDAVGLVVASAVARAAAGALDVGPLGEPLDLLGRWDGAALAVVVDATSSEAPPGTVQVVELGPLAGTSGRSVGSTHGIGVEGVLRIAAAIGAAPRRVVLVGVEGASFAHGVGLSPDVERSVPEAVRRVLELAAAPAPAPAPAPALLWPRSSRRT